MAFDYGAFGGGLAGGAGGIISSAIGQRKGRDFARKEAQKNRRFQRKMSSTQYQRGMADMRKAGLNPILMASGGFGAAATAGGMQSPTDQSVNVPGAMSSAQAGALVGAQLRKTKKEGQLLDYKATTEQALGSESTARTYALTAAYPRADFMRDFYGGKKGKKLLEDQQYIQTYGPAASAVGKVASFIPGPGKALKYLGGKFK